MLKIKYNYDISNISYIKVGGKVKTYIETDDIEVIIKILKVSKKIKYIGNTSNIFFSFYFSNYIFIKYINRMLIIKDYLEIGSSLSIKYLANKLINLGIGGFEKMEGIPCFIGGGIINNCSSFNQCISTNLISVLVIDDFGKIKTMNKEEIDFSYHHSSLVSSNYLIISAKFKIFYQDINELKRSNEFVKKIRREKQPHNKLTLGSTFFKREDICVPLEIELLGLKGKKCSNSCISTIHSNFIEVGKNEKIENITSLIEEANRLLYNKLGYYIDLEIETIRG